MIGRLALWSVVAGCLLILQPQSPTGQLTPVQLCEATYSVDNVTHTAAALLTPGRDAATYAADTLPPHDLRTNGEPLTNTATLHVTPTTAATSNPASSSHVHTPTSSEVHAASASPAGPYSTAGRTSSANANAFASDCRRCIIRIGDYFDPQSNEVYGWAPNPCGYKALRPRDVRSDLLFASPLKDSGDEGSSKGTTMSVAFAGDSTGLRDFTTAVNEYCWPVKILTITKVAAVPPKWAFVSYDPPLAFEAVDPSSGQPLSDKALIAAGRMRTNFTFYNMRYAFFSEGVLRRYMRNACSDPNSGGGYMFMTFGNWDLNWKTHRTESVPGLHRKFDFAAAIQYWKQYVGAMFIALDEEMQRCRAAGRRPPRIMIREQFMPNCAARRFDSKKSRRFKACHTFLVPVVIPFYRRILRGLAWAMNVPVIPVDHMFRNNSRYCAISDGLHLDPPCMTIEQQLLWNAASLVGPRGSGKGSRVLQGWGHVSAASVPAGDALVSPSLLRNATAAEAVPIIADAMEHALHYTEWMTTLGLEQWYSGEKRLLPVVVAPDNDDADASPVTATGGASELAGAGSTPHDAVVTDRDSESHLPVLANRVTGTAPNVIAIAVPDVSLGWQGLMIANIVTLLLIILVCRKLRARRTL